MRNPLGGPVFAAEATSWIDTTISISVLNWLDSPVPGMVANAFSDVLSMPTYLQIMSLEFEE